MEDTHCKIIAFNIINITAFKKNYLIIIILTKIFKINYKDNDLHDIKLIKNYKK